MTKKEIVKQISEEVGLPQLKIKEIVQQTFHAIVDTLLESGRIELRNFGVWTPDGLRDVTSAFRQYQATNETLERLAVGDRPRWLVEIDRFYRTQLGGADPIQEWLTIPMMYFEPPAMCVPLSAVSGRETSASAERTLAL